MVPVQLGVARLPKAIVNLAAVGVVRLRQAAGAAVPRVDRYRAGGAAVDVVRRPR